jgi:hypothetical protein
MSTSGSLGQTKYGLEESKTDGGNIPTPSSLALPLNIHVSVSENTESCFFSHGCLLIGFYCCDGPLDIKPLRKVLPLAGRQPDGGTINTISIRNCQIILAGRVMEIVQHLNVNYFHAILKW